jgi:hypothetical protein
VRAFLVLCGVIAGIFGLLSAQNLGWVRVRARQAPLWHASGTPGGGDHANADGSEATEASSNVERLKAQLAADLRDAQGKNLDPLAVLLEEAIFDRDWDKVQAVAETIRAHGAEWVAPPIAPAPSGTGSVGAEERPLYDLEREVEDRRAARALQLHRNRATALARTHDPALNERLLDLVRNGSDEERVDAATLIAHGGDEPSIQELVTMLGGDAHPLRVAAGIALGREGYLSGLKELCSLVRNAPDAGVRTDAADALSRYAGVRSGDAASGVQALADALAKDDAEAVRIAVAADLGRVDLGQVKPLDDALLDVAVNDAAAGVRLEAAKTAVRWSDRYHVLPGLKRALERALAGERAEPVLKVELAWLAEHGDQETLSAFDEFAATPAGSALAPVVSQAREDLKARLAAAR